MALGCFHKIRGNWNKSLHLQPLQRCYCENSGSSASACVMRRHYSITYTQSLHTINGLLAVGRVGNLLCGRPSYIVIPTKNCSVIKATWRTITGVHETKWMRWVWRNGGMKFVSGERRETRKKKPTQTPFNPQWNQELFCDNGDLTHHHRCGWNEVNEMSVEKWWEARD